MEDAIWDLATRCEHDASMEPYPKGAKARQDELFAKAMAIFDAQAEQIASLIFQLDHQLTFHAAEMKTAKEIFDDMVKRRNDLREQLRKANEALRYYEKCCSPGLGGCGSDYGMRAREVLNDASN